jgi:hypothetical protein
MRGHVPSVHEARAAFSLQRGLCRLEGPDAEMTPLVAFLSHQRVIFMRAVRSNREAYSGNLHALRTFSCKSNLGDIPCEPLFIRALRCWLC